ncbi:Calpain-7 [Hondaea fermentalgiana]|uniref:Calpain-7 n=1 Tax=Hondaea fermentalgiana TaxID=2315210 RepID=A0A2R5GYS3_9STRA|nr:Calpain-7 [Hondaea fermentalgiana]|eukprot:GBG33883.1 Calpain-7 [Hondaea fermentalgiana]
MSYDDDDDDDLEMELELLYETAQAWVDRAHEANARHANFEEAKYTESAIDAFKDTLALESDPSCKTKLIERMSDLQARADDLGKQVSKLPDADDLLSRAVGLDKAGDDAEARSLYLDAADAYKHALQRDPVDLLKSQKKKWTTLLDMAVSRAEAVTKRATTKEFEQSTAHALAAPSEDGKPTREDMRVLQDSSHINGCIFEPWDMASSESWKFDFKEPFCDPDGNLRLSAQQREHCAGWARPRQIWPGQRPRVLAKTPSPGDVVQDYVTNCSFVSSLCLAAYHERKWGRKFISGIIFPQDSSNWPAYNPDGKYIVKLYWNGAPRQVIVDDRFPVTQDRDWVCSHSRRKNELWVSIIEKAYMKLNGGYNFAGSVSGIDLYALTGWIPEAHLMASMAAEGLDFAWNKLLSASRTGDVLTTISTSDIDEEVATQVGLVPLHAYAVLRVIELSDGTRLVLLKNPWRRVRWNGPFSMSDRTNWTPQRIREVGLDLERTQEDNGMFYIDYDSVLNFFHVLFLNWNPELFTHRSVVHRTWPSTAIKPNEALSVADNPQFQLLIDDVGPPPSNPLDDLPAAPTHAVTSAKESLQASPSGTEAKSSIAARDMLLSDTPDNLDEVAGSATSAANDANEDPGEVIDNTPTGLIWILLSRHVVNYAQLLSKDPGDFMTLNVYDRRDGSRVYYPENPLVRGVYSNNPHNLISLQVKPGAHAYTLVVSLYEKLRSMNYSLTVFASIHCRNPVLRPLPLTMRHAQEIQGEWKSHSAGGCPKYPTYMQNPQWSIVFEQDCAMLHLHMNANAEYPINLRLFQKPTGQRRVDCADPRIVKATSGPYRKGFCMLEMHNLEAGVPYTIVASTFTSGQLGTFYLQTEADVPFSIEDVANEAEHLDYRQVIPGNWSAQDGTDGGCPNFGTYAYNPIVRIRCEADITELHVRLRYLPETEDGTCAEWPSLNLSIFSEPVTSRQAQDASFVSNGGIYTNPPCGTIIEDCNLRRGTYFLVPSTFEPMEGDYILVLYSSHPIDAFFEPTRGPPPPGLRKPVPPKPPKVEDTPENLINEGEENTSAVNTDDVAPAYPLPDDDPPPFVKVARNIIKDMAAQDQDADHAQQPSNEPTYL